MVNTYTADNAAKRLNVNKSTVLRGIFDGRFHDCFKSDDGHPGRSCWMIPSDQVEEWVTKGGFKQSSRGSQFAKQTVAREAMKRNTARERKWKADAAAKPKEDSKQHSGRYPIEFEDDIPEGWKDWSKELASLPINRMPANYIPDSKELDFPKYLPQPEHFDSKLVARILEKHTEKDALLDRVSRHLEKVKGDTDGDCFTIRLPREAASKLVLAHIRDQVSEMRVAFDLLNEELKKLEEVVM